MRKRLLIVAIVPVLLGCLEVFAADKGVKSGPQPGTAIPGPFHPFNATKDRKGKYHCLVCRHGLNPVALVFARQAPQADQPLAVLLKKLDEAVAKNREVQLGSFAVFLTEAKEREGSGLVTELEKLDKALELSHVTLAIEQAEGPEKWDLSKDAAITVLLYEEYEVKANFAYATAEALTAGEVDTILAAVQKMAAERAK